MLQEDPERFYRLIDESGVTHRLSAAEDRRFEYGRYGMFSKSRVIENILTTFTEMQALQNNCEYQLKRLPRVVIDSHAYVIIESLARRRRKVYALSGRDMHRYLTQGDSSHMHRVRNERLFLLIRDLFGIESIDFHVYPPMQVNAGLDSQYSDLSSVPKNLWLSSQV